MWKFITQANRIDWRGVGRRWLHSWRAPATFAALIVLAIVWWAIPRRIDRVVIAGDQRGWRTTDAPPRREMIWGSPTPLENLISNVDSATETSKQVPEPAARHGVIAPHLADHGGTLYFASRRHQGQSDIFRTRRIDGEWQTPEPMHIWNSAADDIGAAFSTDGRTAVLFSNRPGGQGGFDLYVSIRVDATWSTPQNLGPGVNSPAHEYDPAIGPEGQLFFSSNRTAEMNSFANRAHENERASGTEDTHPENRGDLPWPTTLRAHPGLTQFDLYVASRGDEGQEWSAPRALTELNSPKSNEGAPFFSPQGVFLYFASDRTVDSTVRPVREDEPANLDLYRARWDGQRFTQVENLGREINSAAHETEPALSPEGFTLVFSSNRDGLDQVYQSSTREVLHDTGWDTSNLQALSRIWWRAFLLTALLVGLLAAFRYSQGWIFQKASTARFLVASLGLHCLILLLMMFMPLAKIVFALAEEIRVANPATQMFDNNQHQSHETGQEAYEKLSDLASLEEQSLPEVQRQATEPVNIPEQSETPILNLPRQNSQNINPNRVEFVPVERPVPEAVAELRKLELARPMPVGLEVAELELEASLPVPMEATPVEQQMDSVAPQLTRQQAVELPRPERDNVARAVELSPPMRRVALPIVTLDEVAILPTDEMATRALPIRTAPHQVPVQVDAVPSVELAATVSRPSDDSLLKAPLEPVQVTRATQADPSVDKELASASKVDSRLPLPAPADVAEALRDSMPEIKAAFTSTSRPLPREIVHRETSPEIQRAQVIDLESAPIPSMERPLAASPIVLDRSTATLPAPSLPTRPELGGPHKRLDTRLIIGELAPQRLDAPPSQSPIVSQLNRPKALAKPVAMAADNVGMQAMFTLRQGETRKEFIELFGGNEASEVAVNKGLEWLAAQQNPDGSWSLQTHEGTSTSDTAGTGFALLPFLAAGHTPQDGKYQPVVSKAVAWLVATQKPNGDLLASKDTSQHHLYAHGVAAIALCEVYGMSQMEEFRGPAQRAIDFIVAAQHAPSGGWRYHPNEAGDTSVVGWQVMALKSGEMAGLTIPANTLEGAKRWLESVESNQPAGGHFGYTGRGATPTMTAEGLLCIQFLGATRNSARMRAGADYLLKNPPATGRETSYYWYYGTQVMYHMQGEYWVAWNEKMRDLLVNTQVKDGANAGTWNPTDQWEKSGGRIYSTSVKLLMLEVYYRHLPLYQQLE